jgi:hypothetical protein
VALGVQRFGVEALRVTEARLGRSDVPTLARDVRERVVRDGRAGVVAKGARARGLDVFGRVALRHAVGEP